MNYKQIDIILKSLTVTNRESRYNAFFWVRTGISLTFTTCKSHFNSNEKLSFSADVGVNISYQNSAYCSTKTGMLNFHQNPHKLALKSFRGITNIRLELLTDFSETP